MEKNKLNGGLQSSRASENGDGESWHKFHDDVASKLLLDKLKKAQGLKDLELLQIVVRQCKAAGMAEHKGVVKAEREIKRIELEAQLQRAMKPEKKDKKEIKEKKEKKETIDTDAISGIIAEMEGLGFDKTPMYHEMATARNVVKRKKRLAALQHDVLMLDRRTMSEMRSYIRPPKVLHEVLQAALLLLGEDEKTAADWNACRARYAQNGRKGLHMTLMKFDASNVEPKLAARCREIIGVYTVEEVQAVSAGAATFYVWARGVIDEVEKRSEGGE